METSFIVEVMSNIAGNHHSTDLAGNTTSITNTAEILTDTSASPANTKMANTMDGKKDGARTAGQLSPDDSEKDAKAANLVNIGESVPVFNIDSKTVDSDSDAEITPGQCERSNRKPKADTEDAGYSGDSSALVSQLTTSPSFPR